MMLKNTKKHMKIIIIKTAEKKRLDVIHTSADKKRLLTKYGSEVYPQCGTSLIVHSWRTGAHMAIINLARFNAVPQVDTSV